MYMCVWDIESELFSCMNRVTIKVYNYHVIIIEIWIWLNNRLPLQNKDVLNPLQFVSAYKTWVLLQLKLTSFIVFRVLKWLIFCKDKIKDSIKYILHPGSILGWKWLSRYPSPELLKRKKIPLSCASNKKCESTVATISTFSTPQSLKVQLWAPSAKICVRYEDNMMTQYCLRCPSGHLPDYTLYMM